MTNGLYDYSEQTLQSLLKTLFGDKNDNVDSTTFTDIPPAANEQILEGIFRPSCKSQLNLRRLRMGSLLHQLGSKCLGWLGGLDYATACNLLIWSHINGDSMFMELKSWGFFNSQSSFEEKSKLVGSAVKVFPKNFKLKMALAELVDLCGHKLVDPLFDLRAECRDLAGGGRSDINRSAAFDYGLNAVIGPETIHSKTVLGFEQYVKDGCWLTTGSSSIGRVDWEWMGKKGHFKARKNMLVDIYSPDEIWDLVSNWDGCIRNKPIVKNELGKMRLAIASNLESYIHEAYLLSIIGHEYVSWKHITLDEREPAYLKRTEKLMKLLKDGFYALPWDFKAFDHQPKTKEIQSILTTIFSRVQLSPSQALVLDRVVKSYSKAELIYDNKPITITGGLQSGQRITSMIGNVWNAAITEAVIKFANLLNPSIVTAEVAVRGDDTYLVVPTAIQAYYIRICYAALFAEGNDAKFSIRQHSCEFLRSEVSANKVTAWPNRAIAAVTQRKPWSDNPWDPAREVITVIDNLRNVERRIGRKLPILEKASKVQWSKFCKQSYKYLELPVRLGGLGILNFDGWVPNTVFPKPSHGSVKITSNLNGKMPEYLSAFASNNEYLRCSISSKISAGDVSKASVDLVSEYLDTIRSLRVVWTRGKPLDTRISNSVIHRVSDVIPIAPNWKFPRDKPPVNLTSSDPTWPRFDAFLSDFNKIKQVASDTIGSVTRKFYPDVYQLLKTLESQGYHRTDAITIILGSFPTERCFDLNPRLVPIVTKGDLLASDSWQFI